MTQEEKPKTSTVHEPEDIPGGVSEEDEESGEESDEYEIEVREHYHTLRSI